jgi:dTDP-4-amino-4,6-dideoxygalactose transaminase
MRPRLARAEDIAPYLARIDASRRYSNAGPLLAELEARLARHFGVEPEQVACIANATLGLLLCLLARDIRPGGRCLLPSWTFEATAVAVQAAGLEPWFHDVAEESWALKASDLLDALAGMPAPVAVIAVSPFGAALELAEWDSFAERSGIPVIVDAAAGFDSLRPSRTPAVLSLHATKLLSTGEGGAVISTDTSFVARIRTLANYGFEPVRRITRAGLNAKMSEYGAAVGLAELDRWPSKRRAVVAAVRVYRESLADCERLAFAPGFDETAVQPTCNVRVQGLSAGALVDSLSGAGIGARKWWGEGCHRHPAFAACPRFALPVTESLADSVVGLPFYPGIAAGEIERVAAAVRHCLQGR